MAPCSLETQQGSGLASASFQTSWRCAPPQPPPPRLLAVPRSSRPLATHPGGRRPPDLGGPRHRPRRAHCGEGLGKEEADAAEGSWWDRCSSRRTRRAARRCSSTRAPPASAAARVLARAARRAAQDRRGVGVARSADRERLRRSTISRAQRPGPTRPARGGPAAAPLDDRGVMEVLRQLTELYDGGHARRQHVLPLPRLTAPATARRSGRSTSWWIWRTGGGGDVVVRVKSKWWRARPRGGSRGAQLQARGCGASARPTGSCAPGAR